MPVHPVRAANRSHVLGVLMDDANVYRPTLARHLNLSLMAVTRIVRELAEAGLVLEGARNARAEPGRRPARLALNPTGAYVLGFEAHAYQQSVVLMDLSGRVVRRKILKLSSPTDGPRSLAEFADQARREIRAARIDPLRLVGAGVALTGVVDRESGLLVDAPYLGWSSLDVAQLLQARLDVPVVVDRIANVLLASEARRSPEASRNAMLVNVGFAMSAAFSVDGIIAHGSRLMAGHIGHMASDDKSRVCSCGQRGCLNAAASGWAALAQLGELHEHVLSAEEFQTDRPKLTELLRAEESGDPAACRALDAVGRILGRTIRQLQIALDPAQIFLSGPVGRARAFADGVRHGVGRDLAPLVAVCERKVADAAALMALDAFVRSPRMDVARLQRANAAARVASNRPVQESLR